MLRLWIFSSEQLEKSDATPLLEGIASLIAQKKSLLDAIAIEGDDVPAVSAQMIEILKTPVWTFEEDLPLVVIDRGAGSLAAAMMGEPARQPA